MVERRDDVAVENTPARSSTRASARPLDAEAPQDGPAATGAVEGVRTDVEVEAVPVTGAGAATEVLGALQQGHGPPGRASVAAAVSPARPPPMTMVRGSCMPPRRSGHGSCDGPDR